MRYRKTAIGAVLAILMALLLTSPIPVTALQGHAHNVATTDSPVAPKITIPITAAGSTVQIGTFVPDLIVTSKANSVRYTWGWVTGTAYYNRAETRTMKTAWGAGVVASGLCAYFWAETAGAACAVSAALMGQWMYVAGNVYADGHCVKIKIPTLWAYGYSGGYCT